MWSIIVIIYIVNNHVCIYVCKCSEDSSQRGVDGPLQGVRAMLAENGPLVPHFLAFIRENTEALWGQILVTTATKQNLCHIIQFDQIYVHDNPTEWNPGNKPTYVNKHLNFPVKWLT